MPSTIPSDAEKKAVEDFLKDEFTEAGKRLSEAETKAFGEWLLANPKEKPLEKLTRYFEYRTAQYHKK
jgi:hypothetical protein